MRIREKFFVIFFTITVFTFFIGYVITSISIKKILDHQIEQTLYSSLYINSIILKNFISDLNSVSSTIKNLKDNKELNKNAETFFNNQKLNILDIRKNKEEILFSKSFLLNKENAKDIGSYSIKNLSGKILNEKKLLLTRKEVKNNLIILFGKIVDESFLNKFFYDKEIDILLFWNSKLLLSTNKSFYHKDIDKNLNLTEKNILTEIQPSDVFLFKLKNLNYKSIHRTIQLENGTLQIVVAISTLFERTIIYQAIINLAIIFVFFLIVLLIFSYYISNNMVRPFYELGKAIYKRDKDSIEKLLERKDEIGEIANQFWEIMDDLFTQYKQKAKVNSLITHDLKTPIIAISRSLEFIIDNKITDEDKKLNLLKMMIKHCNNSLELIKNLLIVQKYELGKINLFISRDNFNNLILECIDGFKILLEEKNIHLTLDLDKNINEFEMDYLELSRVIKNLISNAIKYTEFNGEVLISSKEDEKYIRFIIIDNGIGIKIEDQDQVFDFYKVSSHYLEDSNNSDISTGLGLYLCKQIVEAHKGTIGVKSNSEKGSTFFFSIPKI